MTEPVVIRGQSFPDPGAVAAAFGIKRAAVMAAIRLNRVDRIGLKPSQTRHRSGPNPVPARIAGRVYPSIKAAAEATGRSETTIRNAIEKGREDFVGLGTSRKHRHNPLGRIPGNAKPVVIGPYAFPSKKHLARFLCLSPSTVYDHLRAGRLSLLLARVMARQAAQEGHRKKLPDPTQGARKDEARYRAKEHQRAA